MNDQFFLALKALEKEKGIPMDSILERVRDALEMAVKKDYQGVENVAAVIDIESKTVAIAIKKTVVEEVEDEANQISLEAARQIRADVAVEDIIEIPVNLAELKRVSAQTAKQVIIQGLREAERDMIFDEFSGKEHEVLTAIVRRVDENNGRVILEIGKAEATLTDTERIPGEQIKEGDRLKVYVVEVRSGQRRPQIMISRTHTGLVKRLFETEVPEVHDGIVVVKSVAREAGSRTKVSVYSLENDVDAVGSCIGPKGTRIDKIVDELSGEKIDVINYSENPGEYVAAAIAPATVLSVTPIEGERGFVVVVPESQLSLAIGREGQNVRLAARLTGYKIDIRQENDISIMNL